MSRRIAGHFLKALAFLAGPFPFGLAVATVRGWDALSANRRLLAGWALLFGLSVLLPLLLARAARAVLGHESADADRRLLRTGIATLVVALAAAAVTPWRDLGRWLAATLGELTGFSLPPAAVGP